MAANLILMADVNQAQAPQRQTRIRSKKLSTHIDMTPMVDLAFLLLTFFILTTTLMKVKVMEIVVPEKVVNDPQPPVSASRVITFFLCEKDRVYWRRGLSDSLQTLPYSHVRLSQFIEQKKKEINDVIVLIKATKQSRYKNLVDILDELESAKLKRYYIVDLEPGDDALIRNGKFQINNQ